MRPLNEVRWGSSYFIKWTQQVLEQTSRNLTLTKINHFLKLIAIIFHLHHVQVVIKPFAYGKITFPSLTSSYFIKWTPQVLE